MRSLGPLIAVTALVVAAAPVALADAHDGNETATSAGNETTTANATAEPEANATAADENATDTANASAVVLLSDLGFTECTDGQTVPQVVVDGVGGGPSVLDYVETLCQAPEEAQAASTGIDLGGRIILALFLLIALGIALAVYVRRSYVP